MNFQRTIRNLGPSLITAALIFGPGSLTVTTKLGAGFQYHLLWVIVVSVLFMIAYTRLSAELGLTLNESLIQEIRQRYGKWIAMLLGVGIFCISASFQAGNSIGAGISLTELVGSRAPLWIVVISVLAMVLLFYQSFYKILEKIMIVMVLIMLLCFLVTLIISAPNLVAILQGLVPRVPSGSEILGIALVASSFSIVGAFYQSSLVKEKGWKLTDLPLAQSEAVVGILTLGFLSALVMICAATVLYQSGIEVNTATDLGRALEPLFGTFSSKVFMVGFLAASFSSLLGNATIGGALLADSFSLGQRLTDQKVRWMIILVIIFGAAVSMIFGALPLQLIVFAQAVTILLAPAAAWFILMTGYHQGLISWSQNKIQITLLWAGFFALISLAIYNFNHLFLT